MSDFFAFMPYEPTDRWDTIWRGFNRLARRDAMSGRIAIMLWAAAAEPEFPDSVVPAADIVCLAADPVAAEPAPVLQWWRAAINGALSLVGLG